MSPRNKQGSLCIEIQKRGNSYRRFLVLHHKYLTLREEQRYRDYDFSDEEELQKTDVVRHLSPIHVFKMLNSLVQKSQCC